ncbi:MAG TPA: co-chaperone DjlA [Aeromonadales bacterium]|nr:co-chaperone DjlA [Aeromonadales bacterium]
MSWWGKIVGGTLGFMVGGPIGALFGVYAGHNFDNGLQQDFGSTAKFSRGSQERVQATFFTATFSVMGCIAKADGHISKKEIDFANNIMNEMQLTAEMKKAARELFNKGKQSNFKLNDVLAQFKKETYGRRTLLQMFLEIQIRAASADGSIHQGEKSILYTVSRNLGFSDYELASLISRFNAEQRFDSRQSQSYSSGNQLKHAYGILGLKESCTDQELKRAYRRLMSQHHPDKLIAKGLPEEMMVLATEKTQEIKSAYEMIRKQRKK